MQPEKVKKMDLKKFEVNKECSNKSEEHKHKCHSIYVYECRKNFQKLFKDLKLQKKLIKQNL